MTVRREYTCNLCHMSITDKNGVGIYWEGMRKARPVSLPKSENHLCNSCIEGLRHFIADLDKTAEIYAKRDADEAMEGRMIPTPQAAE